MRRHIDVACRREALYPSLVSRYPPDSYRAMGTSSVTGSPGYTGMPDFSTWVRSKSIQAPFRHTRPFKPKKADKSLRDSVCLSVIVKCCYVIFPFVGNRLIGSRIALKDFSDFQQVLHRVRFKNQHQFGRLDEARISPQPCSN